MGVYHRHMTVIVQCGINRHIHLGFTQQTNASSLDALSRAVTQSSVGVQYSWSGIIIDVNA